MTDTKATDTKATDAKATTESKPTTSESKDVKDVKDLKDDKRATDLKDVKDVKDPKAPSVETKTSTDAELPVKTRVKMYLRFQKFRSPDWFVMVVARSDFKYLTVPSKIQTGNESLFVTAWRSAKPFTDLMWIEGVPHYKEAGSPADLAKIASQDEGPKNLLYGATGIVAMNPETDGWTIWDATSEFVCPVEAVKWNKLPSDNKWIFCGLKSIRELTTGQAVDCGNDLKLEVDPECLTVLSAFQNKETRPLIVTFQRAVKTGPCLLKEETPGTLNGGRQHCRHCGVVTVLDYFMSHIIQRFRFTTYSIL